MDCPYMMSELEGRKGLGNSDNLDNSVGKWPDLRTFLGHEGWKELKQVKIFGQHLWLSLIHI